MKHAFVGGALLAIAPNAALAEDICVTAASDTWQTQKAVKVHAAELGFDVSNLKTEVGCNEVYATDTVGTRLEVFFHPVTFKIHTIKVDI